MRRRCELCKVAEARMYCESDSAHLCWVCDETVHSANFLVERHLRNLLCHVCALPTSWSASGPSLGRSLSVCHRCRRRHTEERDARVAATEEEEEYLSGDEYGSDDDETEEEGDDDVEGEQVVPSQMSSSGRVCLKRPRGDGGDDECSSPDDYGSSSSYRNAISFSAKDNGSVCVDSVNPFKRLQTQSNLACTVQFESTSLETSAQNVETMIPETCNMDHKALAIGSESDDSS